MRYQSNTSLSLGQVSSLDTRYQSHFSVKYRYRRLLECLILSVQKKIFNLFFYVKLKILFVFFRLDIQYSIDDDTESLHKDHPETATNRTPIIKPKYQNQVSNSSELLQGKNFFRNLKKQSKFHTLCVLYTISLFRKKRYMLDKMTQQNA